MLLPFFRTFCFVFFCCCVLPSTLFAQSKRAYIKAGDKAFNAKDYTSAFVYYGNALNKAPDDTDILWKYAESARVFYAYTIAEKAYRQLEKNEAVVQKYPAILFRLGEICKMQGKYDEAKNYFSTYRQTALPTDPLVHKAQIEEEGCLFAKQNANADPGIKITHLDKKVNSPYSDFGAVSRGDTLYYSSYRFEKKKDGSKQRMTRLLMSIGGRNSREPLKGIPAGDSAHVAHTAFSPTGDFLIFNYCKNINPSDIRCELWMVVKDTRGRWTKPARLPEPVNQKGYTSTQPSISADEKTGELKLWFASDRPGGKGGLDIWEMPLDSIWFCPCNKPLDAKKPQKLPRFPAPTPVETVNTEENEITPFFHANTNTLYFSSDGLPGLGGYDVFKSKLNQGKSTPPTNAGVSINSNYNDVYFSLRDNGRTGYISSNRPGAYYLDERNKACCNDIFALAFPEPPQPPVPPSDTLLKPALVVKNIPPIVVPVVPDPPQIKDFVGLPLYFDNDEPDRRTRKTTTNKTYEETVLTYLDRQNIYREKRAEGLVSSAAERAETDVDNFFDNEVRSGYERLGQLCELLLVRLESGQPVEIFIKGFTSPRAQSDYNLHLGRRRISSVRNHMAAWSEGVLQPYIKDGRLKITETSFGETTARLGLSDDLKDERNSVYHPDAARERRVEIVEIK